MIIRNNLSKKHANWNVKWNAPFKGMFSFFEGNTTREYEYPWAFHAIPIKKEMKVLEFGGSLSGFQFVLSKYEAKVDNVDPGMKAKGKGWQVNKQTINKLNKKFNTDVKLYNSFIEKAKLKSNYYDCVYSISVLEHLSKKELENAMKEIYRILKPGGHLIMTIDLFLNLKPFTKKQKNEWGTNISVKKIIKISKLKLIKGQKKELYGFKEFDKETIMQNLHKYVIGLYPVLIQTVILKKDEK